MHDAADDETTHSAASKMQTGTLFHSKMTNKTALRKEIGRELNGATKGGSDHSSSHAAVEAGDTFAAVDGLETMPCASVMMLGTNWSELGVALETGLDEEEGAAGSGADDARRGTAQHVDAEVLGLAVLEEESREAMAHGLVEAETTAIEEDLVDVGGADAAVDATDTLVAHNDAHAVNRAAVVVRLVALVLELALQLHATKGRSQVSWN